MKYRDSTYKIYVYVYVLNYIFIYVYICKNSEQGLAHCKCNVSIRFIITGTFLL